MSIEPRIGPVAAPPMGPVDDTSPGKRSQCAFWREAGRFFFRSGGRPGIRKWGQVHFAHRSHTVRGNWRNAPVPPHRLKEERPVPPHRLKNDLTPFPPTRVFPFLRRVGIQCGMSRQNRRVCRSLRALALLPVVLASPCRAVEEPLCVSNATELRQALLEAAASGFDYDIRLRPGVYFTGGQAFSYSVAAHGLSISGGWSDDHDPCDVQDPHADATILDGQGASAILKLVATGDAPGTHLAIGNLTLRNGATSIDGEAAALALSGALHQELRVQNVVVLGSHNSTPQPQMAT